MLANNDFYKQFNNQQRLTTIQIIYYMPDYQSILQEFLWQALDIPPRFPRMMKFLNYWEKNIEAKIHTVKIGNIEIISSNNIQSIDKIYKLKGK